MVFNLGRLDFKKGRRNENKKRQGERKEDMVKKNQINLNLPFQKTEQTGGGR